MTKPPPISYNPTPTTMNKEPDTKSDRHPAIRAVAFNIRGMHNTILDLHHIINSEIRPTQLYLTDTKHSHIKSIWREALKDYKLTPIPPTLDPSTNRRSVGTILATRRDVYKEATRIQAPPHLTDYLKASTITPHDGSPIIAITT
jgi:hypothetical protein